MQVNRIANIPEAWKLAFALDKVAADFGWEPIFRATAPEEITVTYVKNEDQIPEMVETLKYI